MEKNENEELLEQSPAAIQQEDTQKIAKSGEEEPDTEEQKVSNGRFILWSLAGVYLLYTSYSLCKGYVTGEEGTLSLIHIFRSLAASIAHIRRFI